MPAGHPVLRDAFTLVAKIIRQLAITIDLTAVGPSLSDQFRLPNILLRTLA
jgi:hypothetical protein